MTHARLAMVVLLLGTAAFAAEPLGIQNPAAPAADPAKIDLTVTNHDIGILLGSDEKAASDLVAKIQTSPGDYTPPVIIFMADRLFRASDSENAYFWFCFGRLRFLYDAERCADVTARAAFGEMMKSIKPDLRRYPTKMKPDDIVAFAQRVLHLDSITPYNYDQRWINLNGKDAFSGSDRPMSLPESEWEGIHRKICKDYLVGAEAMVEELKSVPAAP